MVTDRVLEPRQLRLQHLHQDQPRFRLQHRDQPQPQLLHQDTALRVQGTVTMDLDTVRALLRLQLQHRLQRQAIILVITDREITRTIMAIMGQGTTQARPATTVRGITKTITAITDQEIIKARMVTTDRVAARLPLHPNYKNPDIGFPIRGFLFK